MTAVAREIGSLVPHSSTMLLIQAPFEELEAGARASVRVAEDSLFFCPGKGVPGWVGIEYMAQTVALHAGIVAARHGRQIKIGFLLGTRRYVATCAYFRLGSRLRIDVLEEWQDGQMAVYKCSIADQHGTDLASAELNVFQPADAMKFIEGE